VPAGHDGLLPVVHHAVRWQNPVRFSRCLTIDLYTCHLSRACVTSAWLFYCNNSYLSLWRRIDVWLVGVMTLRLLCNLVMRANQNSPTYCCWNSGCCVGVHTRNPFKKMSQRSRDRASVMDDESGESWSLYGMGYCGTSSSQMTAYASHGLPCN